MLNKDYNKQTVFYQSSLPRAGSTLLQNIIGQNPLFHVTPTSGMIDMMLGARIGYNGNKEAYAGDKNKWREGFYFVLPILIRFFQVPRFGNIG